MKTIQLTKGFQTIVDDEDYDWLTKRSWHAKQNNGSNIYACSSTTINKKKVAMRMHRYILGITDPSILVDHRNGDSLDNRRCNLRVCDAYQNSWNRKLTRNDVGVSLKNDKWCVSLRVKKKEIELVGFKSKESAVFVYNKVVSFYRGDFASLNELDESLVDFNEIYEKITTPKHKMPKNIYFRKDRSMFMAKFRLPSGKLKNVGDYPTIEEAEDALLPYQALIKAHEEKVKVRGLEEFIAALKDDPRINLNKSAL